MMNAVVSFVARKQYDCAAKLLQSMKGFTTQDVSVITKVLENDHPHIAGHVARHCKTKDDQAAFKRHLKYTCKLQDVTCIGFALAYVPCYSVSLLGFCATVPILLEECGFGFFLGAGSYAFFCLGHALELAADSTRSRQQCIKKAIKETEYIESCDLM
jgi:hypothetical protein